MTHITRIEKDIQLEEILGKDQLTVVEYTARHCSHCRAIAPQIAKIAQEFAGKVSFVEVDVDDLAQIVSTYKISVTPTFQFYRRAVLLSTFNAASLPADSPSNLVPSIINLVKLFVTKYNPGYNKLTDELAFSTQIEEKWIAKLADVGFLAVIDLSSNGDEGHLPDEENILQSIGVKYIHHPIHSISQVAPPIMDNLGNHLRSLPKPLLVHSPIGLHASIILLTFTAKVHGKNWNDVVGWARDFGFDYEGLPEVIRFLQNYLSN